MAGNSRTPHTIGEENLLGRQRVYLISVDEDIISMDDFTNQDLAHVAVIHVVREMK